MKNILYIILAIIIIGAIFYFYKGKDMTYFDRGVKLDQNTETKAPINNLETSSAINNVTLSSFSFNPETLKIKAGTMVTWTNNDDVGHSIISDEGDEIKSEIIRKDNTYSHTFNTAGIFPYHCGQHNMKGVIIVE